LLTWLILTKQLSSRTKNPKDQHSASFMTCLPENFSAVAVSYPFTNKPSVMFNQHRLQRVLELISVLKTNPPKSSRYLAQFMEVSGRSIYRYFKMLQSLCFKVTKGPNFTYYIPEDENGQKAAYRFTIEEVALFEKYFVGVEGNNPLVQSMKGN